MCSNLQLFEIKIFIPWERQNLKLQLSMLISKFYVVDESMEDQGVSNSMHYCIDA